MELPPISCRDRTDDGSFTNRHLLLTVLEAAKSNVKVLADLVSGRTLSLVCGRLPPRCPHRAERAISGPCFSSYKDTRPIIRVPPS